jgi:Leucine-rich repeat (LRR) protein
MKHKLGVGILIGLIFGIVVVSSLIIMKQQAGTFPDKNLEEAVREAIGKPTGPIHAADLKKLTELDVDFVGIADLTGLEYCTNLEELGLQFNQISGVSTLSRLTNLKELGLDHNQISDVSALSKLTNLKWLWLNHNQISDIKPLVSNSGLSKGDLVNLANNPLSSTSTNVYIPQLEKRGILVVLE